VIRTALLAVLLCGVLAGCRGERGVRCEDSERYSSAQEVPPVRVPDDLSVPDEQQALRIPPAPGAVARPALPSQGSCLEQPPEYFENGEPGEAGNPG
jgi:uncharacterized lipoprotein